MKQLAIIGAGGHGKVVAESAELAGWQSIVFFDDVYSELKSHAVWPVWGNVATLLEKISVFDAGIVAVGNNALRLSLSKKLMNQGLPLATIIHPSAVVSRYAEVQSGSVVFAGSVINPFAKLGMAAIVNTGAIIDHDCILGDAVHISPGAHLAGGVAVGHCSWIGIGACVRQNIIIGDQVMVGAGAAVVKNILNGQCVAGVPASELKR